MSNVEAAKAAAQKRSTSVAKTSGKTASSAGKAGEKYYSGDSGIKVQPKTVLVISLVYMGVVLLLHIFGKLRGSSVSAPSASGDV